MPILLFDLKASRLMNKTPFVHHLKVYDTAMVYDKRKLFRRFEITISYSHVSQVNLVNELFFSHLEIINTGGVENIFIRFVKKKDAKKAKSLIDQKIHRVHGVGYLATHGLNQESKEANPQASKTIPTEVANHERSLARLEELLQRGRLTKKEYNKKRSELLKA